MYEENSLKCEHVFISQEFDCIWTIKHLIIQESNVLNFQIVCVWEY